MNYSVLTLLILLNVFSSVPTQSSPTAGQSSSASGRSSSAAGQGSSVAVQNSSAAGQSSSATPTTTPQPLTFDCVDGSVSNISGINITNDALLVENGTSGILCHITDNSCIWQNKTMLHVIYDIDEKDKHSKFVAGKLFRYELQCKSGYLARANATAFEIHSLTTKKYFHQEHTVTAPMSRTIQVKIFKKVDNTELTEKVYVGDELALKIIGPASHSLKPINCTAYNGNSKSQTHTLWNNTHCSSYDNAIMSNDWRKENDNHTIAIDMFAFRFVDSYSVTIECSAYVCPQNDSNCGVTIKNCMTTVAPGTTAVTLNPTTVKPSQTTASPSTSENSAHAGRRRRRSMIKNDYKEDIASTSFTVVDSLGDSNGSAGLSLNTLLQFTVLLVCMCAIGKGDSYLGE